MAVVALERIQDGPADLLRQPQSPGQARPDLAVRPRPLGLQPGHAGRAAQRLQLARAHVWAGQELLRLSRHGRVDQVASRPHRDIVAAERRRYLVRRRRAANEPQQRPVVDLPLPQQIEPRPPGQLGREQARAHRLAGRMAASEVAGHRQRGDHPAHPHQFTHGRKSKARPGSAELNTYLARAAGDTPADPSLMAKGNERHVWW